MPNILDGVSRLSNTSGGPIGVEYGLYWLSLVNAKCLLICGEAESFKQVDFGGVEIKSMHIFVASD